MLDVSSAAAEAINALTASAGQRDGAGLRIQVADTTEQGAELQVSITDHPAPDDEVITSSAGSTVFVQPYAALYLTDKVLDAYKDVDGNVHFTSHSKI
jgi:iron-sulfur cluster assembly protein